MEFNEKDHDRIVVSLIYNLVRDYLLVLVHCVFTWKCFAPLTYSSTPDYPLYNDYEDPYIRLDGFRDP